MTLISTSQDLKQFLNQLPAYPKYVALDTEFMREKTYWPHVCLIQMAVGHHAVAIDPLVPGIDLTPLWDFLKRPDILKIFHAARQDLEGLLRLTGQILLPFFDTQVAAQAYGMRENISYEDLVSTLLGQSLDKSQRVVDWAGRPLSDQKIQYALNDVIYLIQAYPLVAKQLKEWKRETWIAEEMAVLSSLETYLPAPLKAWKKVKGWAFIKGLTPRGFLLLQKIAAWREEQASLQNTARRLVLRDEMICTYVTAFQKDPSFLKHETCGVILTEIVQPLIEEIQHIDPANLPSLSRKVISSERERACQQALSQLLKETAIKASVAQRLVGTRDDLERLIRKWHHHKTSDLMSEVLLTGWRYDIFGKAALEILEKMN